MTVSVSIWSADQSTGFKKQKSKGSLVYYTGSVIIEGEFTYSKTDEDQEVIGDQVCFYPIKKDGKLIPREKDLRDPWFCFKDTKRAIDLLGISKLIKDPKVCNISGNATVELTNYVVDKAETETNDIADLVKVIKESKPVTKKFSKNGQECK